MSTNKNFLWRSYVKELFFFFSFESRALLSLFRLPHLSWPHYSRCLRLNIICNFLHNIYICWFSISFKHKQHIRLWNHYSMLFYYETRTHNFDYISWIFFYSCWMMMLRVLIFFSFSEQFTRFACTFHLQHTDEK